jgi:hypothetical protein
MTFKNSVFQVPRCPPVQCGGLIDPPTSWKTGIRTAWTAAGHPSTWAFGKPDTRFRCPVDMINDLDRPDSWNNTPDLRKQIFARFLSNFAHDHDP